MAFWLVKFHLMLYLELACIRKVSREIITSHFSLPGGENLYLLAHY